MAPLSSSIKERLSKSERKEDVLVWGALLGEAPDGALDALGLDKPGNSYLEQANEFLSRSGASGIYQKLTTVLTQEQWTASRYVELYNWYQSGEYDEVLEGSE